MAPSAAVASLRPPVSSTAYMLPLSFGRVGARGTPARSRAGARGRGGRSGATQTTAALLGYGQWFGVVCPRLRCDLLPRHTSSAIVRPWSDSESRRCPQSCSLRSGPVCQVVHAPWSGFGRGMSRGSFRQSVNGDQMFPGGHQCQLAHELLHAYAVPRRACGPGQ